MPRQHERVPFLMGITLESASGKRDARVSDISTGGCFIDTIIDARLGDEVRFDLSDPTGSTLSFSGKVAYHFDGVGFGVTFTDLREEQKVFLERIIKTQQN